MNVLDTDALSHLQKSDSIGVLIAVQLHAAADPDFRITTVSAYEMLGGAVDLIRQLNKNKKTLIPGFQLLQELVEYLTDWHGLVIRYDDAADRAYLKLSPRLRQELKNDARIAAIALAHGAAVWTCNVNDYKQVPGLTVHSADTGLRVI